MTRPPAPGKRAPRLLSGPLSWVFLACLAYWTYLIVTTRMIVQYDAAEYEALGRMLLERGWGEYFRTGPNREPGYPLVVSLSMLLGRGLAIPYQQVLAFLQLGVLFVSQLLAARTLRILGVREPIVALTVLYLGISPAIVNSALSLFSEVVTYPLVLASVLLLHRGWLDLAGPRGRLVRTAAAAGVTLAALALCKVVFEAVAPVLLLAFLLAGLLTRRAGTMSNSLLFAAVLAIAFSVPIAGIRAANWSLNGQFAVTNRGDWLLYGSAARRAEPLTRERFLAAVASVPGDAVCERISGSENCLFWSFRTSDRLANEKMSELAREAGSPHELSRAMVREALSVIARHPLQFVVLSAVEAGKMFFWESTQLGYVVYPPGLARLFRWTPFKDGVRLLLALLTLLGCVHLAAHSWRQRRAVLAAPGHAPAASGILPLSILLLVGAFIGAYALFSIVTRYALPVAPLFLIGIAFMIDARVRRR